MRADNALIATDNTDLSKELRFAVAIDFDGTAQFFTSHDDIANVPGTPIENCLQGLSATTQTLNPDRANATIGAASFDLVDLNEAFTDHVRTELLTNAVGLRGRTVNMYIGYVTDQDGAGITDGSSTDDNPDFDNFALFQTQVVDSVETKEGKYTIKCADIQRQTKREIFELALTYLTASITETDTTIPCLDISGFEGLQHGTSYSDAPGQEVIYIQLDKTKEIIRCPVSGISGNSFTGVTRGVFGTGAAPVEVDLAKASDRKPKVEEYVYLEMPAVKLANAILTGDIEGTSDVLPSGWHAGVDPAFVRLSDFTGIGTDLWDTNDDTAGIVLRFDGIEKQDAKRFLETEIYLLLGLFSPVYADGQLGLKRMVPSLSDSPFSAFVTDANVKSHGNLKHDMNAMQNNLRVDWNWNGDRYIRSTIVVDSGSIQKHGQAQEKRLQFRGLVGSIYTEQVLRQLLTSLRDMYTGPPLRLDVQGFHLLNQLEVGDTVRATLSGIRDYTQIGSSLNRTMAIHGMTVDWLGGVKLKLFGSSERADEIPPVTATTCLPDEFYDQEGASLSTIPGLMSGNTTNAGTFTLSGDPDMNAAGAIFYWDNDLTISSGTTLIIEDNVQLRVLGFLTINGTIDGTGEGVDPPADDGYTAGQHYYWAADESFGAAGFIGNSMAHMGLLFRYPNDGGIPDWVWATRKNPITNGLYQAFPNLVLSVDETGNGAIVGIPTDMRGGSGSWGSPAGEKTGISGRSYQRAPGGQGGAGGAALCVVCRGGDFGVSGQITLNGDDSVEPTAFYAEQGGDYDIYGGSGGAGAPGALLWLLDGSAVTFPDLAGHFEAKTGVTPAQYALPRVGDQGQWFNQSLSENNRPRKNMAPFDPNYDISDYDQTAVNFRIQYLPCDITPEEDQDELVPPPTDLVANPFDGGTEIDWINPAQAAFDHIEVWVANANARAGASLLLTTQNSAYIENAANIQRERYYWVRAVDAVGNKSEFEPSTTTTTAVAYPQIATPGIVIDPFIRLGAANWVFLNDGAEPDCIAEYEAGVGTAGTDALELQNDVDLVNFEYTQARQVYRRGPDEWDAEAFPGMVIEFRVRMSFLNTITTNPFAPKIDLFVSTSKEDGSNGRTYTATGGKYWNTAGEDNTWYDMLYTVEIDNEPDPPDDEPRYISFGFRTINGFVFQQHVYIDFVDATVQNQVFKSDAVAGGGVIGQVPQIVDSIQGRVLNDLGGWAMSPGGQTQPKYQFDNTTTSGDPGAGKVRFDNASIGSVTNLYISSTDEDGFDTDTVLNFIADENRIFVEAGSNKNRAAVFEVNGTPTDNTGWWTIPVTVVASDTTPGANEYLGLAVQFTSAGGGGGGVTTFNGRSGAVSPIQADYDSFFLTPAEGDAAYAALSHTHLIADITDFTDNSANWNTAFGWGDHSIAGYAELSANEVVTGNWTFEIDTIGDIFFERQNATGASGIGFSNTDGAKGYIGFDDNENFTAYDGSASIIFQVLAGGDVITEPNTTIYIGASGRGNSLPHLVMQNTGTDPSSPPAGSLWYGAAGLKFHDGTSEYSLTGNLDRAVDEDITGQWDFEDFVGIRYEGEGLRMAGTANDSNANSWITWSDAIGFEYGSVGKRSNGHIIELVSSGDIEIKSGGAGSSEILLDATGGALAGRIVAQPNSLDGSFRVLHESSGDFFDITPDGTNIVLTTGGGAQLQADTDISLLDNSLIRPLIDDFAIRHQAITATATTTLNHTLGQSIALTLAGVNISTLNLTNWPASGRLGQMQIEIIQGATPRTIAWPAAVEWQGGSAPDISTASETYMVLLSTRDGGTTVIGSFIKDSTAGVGIQGTPVANQVAIWNSASLLEGDTGFTFDGSILGLFDNTLERPHLDDYSIQHQNVTGIASTTINYSSGQSVNLQLGANNVTSMSVSNWPASGRKGVLEILVTQGATTRTVVWPSGTNWPGNVAPDLDTANGRFLVYLTTVNGGTDIDGTYTEALS